MVLGAFGVGGLSLFMVDALQPPPEPSASQQDEYRYYQASAALHGGDYAEAARQFEVLQRQHPRDPRMAVSLGEALLAVGQLKGAREAFEKAVLLDPQRASSWSRLGVLRANAGELDGAKDALEKALSLNPRDSDALEQRAELAAAEGQVDAAIRDFIAAIEAAVPQQRPAMFARAAQILVEAEKLEDAVALLRQAREKGVTSVGMLETLGELELRIGALEAAAITYRQAAVAANRDASLWLVLAEILTQLGQNTEAEQALRQSLQVEDRAPAHVALGRLALKRGDRATAEAELEAAATSVSGATEREMVEISELLAALGREKDALKVLSSVAGEEEQSGNLELQRRTASLAKKLGDRDVMRAACARVTSLDAGSCP